MKEIDRLLKLKVKKDLLEKGFVPAIKELRTMFDLRQAEDDTATPDNTLGLKDAKEFVEEVRDTLATEVTFSIVVNSGFEASSVRRDLLDIIRKFDRFVEWHIADKLADKEVTKG